MLVEMDGVERKYGSTRALDGLTLSIPEGSITGLVGPNGAGKTTSMQIISTLIPRHGGKVVVGGHDPQVNPKAVRKMIGYMPDFFGFYDGLTSHEYLDFFGAIQGVPSARRPAVIADLLALVDLEDKATANVNGLSRGMKQRLSLARALVHDPELLILDEPASGLDPRARIHLRELIGEMSRLGKTVLISSHILSELEGICSHLAIIDGGTVKAYGTMDEIRESIVSARRIVARIADSDVDRAQDLVGSDPDVSGVDVEVGRIRFVSSGGDNHSAAILSNLVTSGVTVYEWRTEAAGLEELFLQITEDRK